MIFLFLLLLIDLKDSSLFKIIMATIYLTVYLYIMYGVYIYIYLHNNKMKDSSDMRDRKKDFGLLL